MGVINTHDLDLQIMAINNIVEESVKHGADDGGSYANNPFGLVAALENWIKINDFEGLCCVKMVDNDDDWCGIKIVRTIGDR